MQCKIILIFFQIIIFCNKYNFANAKALIGQNVRQADQFEYNFVVCFLKLADEVLPSNIFCAGTLISQTIVLTSQQCFENIPEQGIEIRAGSTDLRFATRHLSIWWLGYGRWKEINNERPRYIYNDIAVTKLVSPVTNAIIPAVPSQAANRYFIGTRVLVAGWGKTNTGHMSMIMQTANLTIISNRACTQRATRLSGTHQFMTYAELCSIGNPYTLLELGDGGGPILHSNTVIGVNIGTFPNLEGFNSEIVNFHSSVYHYRDFIADVLLDSD